MNEPLQESGRRFAAPHTPGAKCSESMMQTTTTNGTPPHFADASTQRQKTRSSGLHPDYWYAVEFDRVLKRGQVIEVRFWNRSIALYRGQDGQVHALENRCAHRQVKLSLGNVEGCNLTCCYHGWSYGGDGKLQEMKHDLFGRSLLKVQLRSYPVQVRYGLIWIFPGDPALAGERKLPDIPELEGSRPWACVPIDFTWQAHYSMVLENIVDFTHAYLHRKYRPFVDARLARCETQGDSISIAYETQVGQGKVSGLFVDRQRCDTNSMELGIDYPYQWSNTGGKIKHWCFMAPLDERTTRAFFLFYFDAFRIPFTPFRLPRWVMTPFLKIAKRLLIRPLLHQDGYAVEAEQIGYEHHYNAPMIELNPVIHACQQVLIRKWEEHLAKTEQ